MPFYSFHCDQCDNQKKVLTTLDKAKDATYSCSVCVSGSMKMRLGAPAALAKETSDEYRGKSVDQGISQKLRDRSAEHFRKHELPRMIDKHGKEYATKEGFLDAEGNPIDKRK